MSDFRVEDIPAGWMNQIIYSLKHEWSTLKIIKIIQAWNGANIDLRGRIRLAKAVMDLIRSELDKERREGLTGGFFRHTHTEQSKAGCLACGEEDCPSGWPHHYRFRFGGFRCSECNPLIMPSLEQDCPHPSEKMEPTGNGQGRCGVCGEDGFQLEAEDCDPRIEIDDYDDYAGSSHPFPGDHFMAISPPPVVYHRLVESWDAENVKYLAAKLAEAEGEGKALLIDAKSVSGLLAWLSP